MTEKTKEWKLGKILVSGRDYPVVGEFIIGCVVIKLVKKWEKQN